MIEAHPSFTELEFRVARLLSGRAKISSQATRALLDFCNLGCGRFEAFTKLIALQPYALFRFELNRELRLGGFDLGEQYFSSQSSGLDLLVASFDPALGLTFCLFGSRSCLAQPQTMVVTGAIGNAKFCHLALTPGKVSTG